LAAFAVVAASGAAVAQPDTAPEQPKIAERPQSLKLESSTPTVSLGVAQAGREIMTTRQIPFAPGSWEVTAEARRGIAQLRDIYRGNAPKGAPFVILVSGGDEVVNYRRARALRTVLVEMQLEDAAKVAIAARAAGEGQAEDEGKARVDLVPLDPSRCGGCGEIPFRTIVLDTGVAKLVRASAEDVIVAARSEKEAAEVSSAPLPPARPQAQKAQRTEQRAPRLSALPAPEEQALRRRPARSRGGCARPDIIIDDYYPGGPLIGCDGSYGPRPRW
jgi:hypothetical protein